MQLDRRVLTAEEKNKISKLLESDFIAELLKNRLPQYYPDFGAIQKIESKIYKKYIGKTRVFFVIGFDIVYTAKDSGHINAIKIFASAHTDGSRKKASDNAERLYSNGFSSGKYQVTRPLFYLPEQSAFFYEASVGSSFLSFLEKDPHRDFKPILQLAAGWIKKLHSTDLADKYEWEKFDVMKISPLPRLFGDDFFEKYQEYGELVLWLIDEMKKLKASFDESTSQVVIYGDYHPQNVIITKLDADTMKMIDFTDVCVGDPMADIGVFVQQFEFMTHHYYTDVEADKYKKLFIEYYFGQRFDEVDIKYIKAINLYQSWTALRSATFLFYMENLGSAVGPVLAESKKLLELAKSDTRQISTFL